MSVTVKVSAGLVEHVVDDRHGDRPARHAGREEQRAARRSEVGAGSGGHAAQHVAHAVIAAGGPDALDRQRHGAGGLTHRHRRHGELEACLLVVHDRQRRRRLGAERHLRAR